MPRIQPNPEAKPMGDFPVVAKGTYRMVIDPNPEEVKEEQSKAGNSMLRFLVRFADPYHELKDENGEALTQDPGTIFHRCVTAPKEKQGMLCALVSGCGIAWTSWDGDTDTLAGRVFEAQVGIEEYEGRKRNSIRRVSLPKEVVA